MVIGIAYFFSLLFLISFFLIKRNNKHFIYPLNQYTYLFAFIIKLLIGSFFVYYYLNINFDPNEPSDVYRFFNEGKSLNNLFFNSPKVYIDLLFNSNSDPAICKEYFSKSFLWLNNDSNLINDTHNLIRIHSLLHFISFNNIYIHVLIINLLVTIGLIKLYETIQRFSKIKPIYLFSILLLSPSIIFWTSGILKESFLLIGIGFLVNSLLIPNLTKTRILNFSVGLLFLILFKPYLLLVIVVLIPLLILHQYIFKNNLLKSISAYAILIFTIILLFPSISNKITTKISRKQFDMINLAEGGIHVYGPNCYYYFTPKSYHNFKQNNNQITITKPTKAYKLDILLKEKPEVINLFPSSKKYNIHIIMPGSTSSFEVTPINNSFFQLIKNIPESIINALLRPFPNEKFNLMSLPIQIESFFTIICLFFVLTHRQQLDYQKQFLILFLISFSLILLLIIGWTTPISGAIIRFRFPIQIAIIFIIAIIFNNKKDTKIDV